MQIHTSRRLCLSSKTPVGAENTRVLFNRHENNTNFSFHLQPYSLFVVFSKYDIRFRRPAALFPKQHKIVSIVVMEFPAGVR